MGESNRNVATTVNTAGVGIKRKETNDENEYEQLKARFIDAKNVPIWEEPTESSLVQSSAVLHLLQKRQPTKRSVGATRGAKI